MNGGSGDNTIGWVLLVLLLLGIAYYLGARNPDPPDSGAHYGDDRQIWD